MNALPDARALEGDAAGSRPRSALVTASYRGDIERCRLLCETVDAHVTGFTRHYLLVSGEDVGLFRPLESPRRVVVDERDLLPGWLRSLPDPASLFRRRIWLSLRTMPLRGWHVQQLRRIALAAHVEDASLVFCDSDVAFLKPFDCRSFWRGGDLRLLRRDGALERPGHGEQLLWSGNAGRALGLGSAPSPHDYIATLIAWRRDATLSMIRRIEAVGGRHWIEAVARGRRFSECMLYGRHADEVLGGTGHFASAVELCRIYWKGAAPSDADLEAFVDAMEPEQVAVGLQSFIGIEPTRIRRLLVRA